MSLTQQQLAKIQQKESALPDALKRDPLTNYYEGYFFVTLNTRGAAPILSSVKGKVDGVGADAPHCEYEELGEKVLKIWKTVPDFHPSVTLIDAEAMPEHFHGLLYLKTGGKEHLGKVINGFMIGCTHEYWDVLGIDWGSMKGRAAARDAGSNSARNTGSMKKWSDSKWQDKDHMGSFRGPALFVRGYNDVEPITEEEVQIKINYIRDQAKKRLIQGDRHECFRKYRHQHSKSWTVERCMQAIAVDRTFRYNTERCKAAQDKVKARLITDAQGIGLDFIGSKALLYSQKKLPLVCHSADAGRFEEQKEAVMDAARKEWTIVSAFISQKERDIKQQLMVEGLPFIDITDNGYSDRYKGTGKAFYALAEDRLCQISPWTYLYQKDTPTKDGEKKAATISREMCLVMNELARVISEQEDDWWKTWSR